MDVVVILLKPKFQESEKGKVAWMIVKAPYFMSPLVIRNSEVWCSKSSTSDCWSKGGWRGAWSLHLLCCFL